MPKNCLGYFNLSAILGSWEIEYISSSKDCFRFIAERLEAIFLLYDELAIWPAKSFQSFRFLNDIFAARFCIILHVPVRNLSKPVKYSVVSDCSIQIVSYSS